MANAQDYIKDFPLLHTQMNGKPIAYLDNGATTQKPEQVIKSLCGYYGGCNANPHRGAYELSVKATDIYENARARVAKFIHAPRPETIIFTRNATESLNLVAYSYGLTNVQQGDEIVITVAEHHSNLVPWQHVAQAKGATLKYIYLTDDANLSDEDIETKITEKTKIVAVTQVSNVLGLVNDVKKVVKKAHSVGAICVVDGSQSVPHMKVDVQDIDADFFAFSGVEEQHTDFAEVPAKFEAGTQNVGGATGLSAAIDYLEGVGFDTVEAIEKDLVDYALPQLRELPYIELYGCDSRRDNKTGIITFNVKDVHPHDVATILDSYGVAVRAGHHCAQPLMQYLGQNATCRASFYFYNTREDVDRWIAALKQVRKVLGYGA